MDISIIPVTHFRQNCAVVRCPRSGRGAVVDPGGEPETLMAALDSMSIEIERILITHGHMDHAGAAAGLSRALEVPIEGPHRDDAFLIDRIPAQGERYGLAGMESFEPDRWLAHGDRVQVGELTFEVLHCPGHTPGHVVFFEATARQCFVGDVIFAGSVGRSDMSYGNHDELVAAIRGKLFPLGDDVTFLPGHGQTSTFGWERKCNPFVADLMFDD